MFVYSLCVCLLCWFCTDGNRKPPTSALIGLTVPCQETLLFPHPVLFSCLHGMVVLQDVHQPMNPYRESLDFSLQNKFRTTCQLSPFPTQQKISSRKNYLLKLSYTNCSDLLNIFISNNCNTACSKKFDIILCPFSFS